MLWALTRGAYTKKIHPSVHSVQQGGVTPYRLKDIHYIYLFKGTPLLGSSSAFSSIFAIPLVAFAVQSSDAKHQLRSVGLGLAGVDPPTSLLAPYSFEPADMYEKVGETLLEGVPPKYTH